jgi:hypothetical protein
MHIRLVTIQMLSRLRPQASKQPVAMVREVAKDKKKPESGDKPPAPADEDDSDSDDTETSTDTMPVKWDPPDPVKKPKKKSFVEAVKFNAELSQWNFHVATTRSSRTSDNGRVYDWSNVNKDEEYSLDGVTLYGAEGAIETRLLGHLQFWMELLNRRLSVPTSHSASMISILRTALYGLRPAAHLMAVTNGLKWT